MKLGNSALSDVVGYILILMIVTSTMSLLFLWFNPFIEKTKTESQLNNVFTQLKGLNEKINSVLSQGPNASGNVDITIEKGEINIDESGGQRIIIYYSLDPDYTFTVSDITDGDISFRLTMNSRDTDITYPADIRADIDWLNHKILGTDVGGNPIFVDTIDQTFDNSGDTNQYRNNYDKSLSDMVVINLTDITDADNHVYFGKIWIFDTGSFNYEIPSTFGSYRATVENNGIIVAYPDSDYLIQKQPFIYEDKIEYNNIEGSEDYRFELNMRLIQIKHNITRNTGASGNGKIRCFVKSNSTMGTFSRASHNDTYYLNMNIINLDAYEKDKEAWRYYFINNHGFVGVKDGDSFLTYNPSDPDWEPSTPTPLRFSLSQSIIEMGVNTIE